MKRNWIISAILAGGLLMAQSAHAGGTCPQPRKTKSAPPNIAGKAIPASADAAAGKTLYQKSAKPMACKMCHGENGDGNGKLGKALKPNPRNFTCQDTMKDVSPGQMFWIIKNGSKGTGMVAHGKTLSDDDIWNVIKYIRTDFLKE
jgi:mono/diheme cytochrome c family protein